MINFHERDDETEATYHLGNLLYAVVHTQILSRGQGIPAILSLVLSLGWYATTYF